MRIAGIDEVGMSSIAGPVMACVVVAESRSPLEGIRDSKKLSKKRRELLVPVIKANCDWALGAASMREIERLNVYWARYLAMRRAVEKLIRRKVAFDRIIVDGNRTIDGLPLSIPQEAHTKADDKFWEVSAASIVAKVTRDDLMSELAKREGLGHYRWDKNAGYYTPEHRDGIILHGPSTHHRVTFDYFKYCMFARREYEKFLADGKTADSYFEYQRAYEGGHYRAWKRGDLNPWKPVIHGA